MSSLDYIDYHVVSIHSKFLILENHNAIMIGKNYNIIIFTTNQETSNLTKSFLLQSMLDRDFAFDNITSMIIGFVTEKLK